MNNKNLPVLLCVFLLLCFSSLAQVIIPEEITNAAKSIVRVQHHAGIGTGFFIDENTLVTNFHVVDIVKRKSSIQLSTNTGKPIKVNHVKVRQLSAEYDLAILEVSVDFPPVDNLMDLLYGTSHTLPLAPVPRKPNWEGAAYVIGYPGGQKTTDLSIGHAMGYLNTDQEEKIMYIEFNKRTEKGSSGSPILNAQGEIIGIYSNITDYQIPVSHLRELINREPLPQQKIQTLIENESERLEKTIGTVERPLDSIMTKGATIRHLEDQAKQGIAMAQYNLASILLYSDPEDIEEIKELEGMEIDDVTKKGLEWMQEAAENNFAPAQYKIGSNAKDAKIKFEWLEKSALQGFTSAQYDLAKLFLEGTGTEKDIKKGLEWMQEAANNNFMPAQYDLAKLYGEHTEIERNYKLATEILFVLIQKEIFLLQKIIRSLERNLNRFKTIKGMPQILITQQEEETQKYKERLQKTRKQYEEGKALARENKWETAFPLMKQAVEEIFKFKDIEIPGTLALDEKSDNNSIESKNIEANQSASTCSEALSK